MSGEARVSVVIPTYQREQVLVETLERLRMARPEPFEILVVDQTSAHARETRDALLRLNGVGAIRWIQQQPPSIPAAMNRGLLEAAGDIVLFLDDDVIPESHLIEAHRRAHEQKGNVIVAGRVLQPWHLRNEEVIEYEAPFTRREGTWIEEFMGGNFSIHRARALALGGFDENFVHAAYRFEAEFAHRHLAKGGLIWYEPAATVRHLHVRAGGTRSHGSHLTTIGPAHAVGAYYFALRTGGIASCVRRPLRSVLTRHHLRHPWWIPVTLVSELRGLLLARRLNQSGPRLIGTPRI